MKKIYSLTSSENIINITFNITYKCNFKCHYCYAWEVNEKTFKFDLKNKSKLTYFIESIEKNYPDLKINFLITWWEPLLNKDFCKLIEFLLDFNSVFITVTSNIFLLWNITEKLDLFENERFILIPTFHFYEYKKYDLKSEIFIKNINKLKEYNIKFDINFLIPTSYEDFEDFLKMKQNIIYKCSLEKHQHHLNLIQENQVISENYDKKIIDYYYKEDKKSIAENTIKLQYSDTSIQFHDNKNIILKSLNQFKWYKCFPFEIPSNILIDYDLNIIFAWCSTMINKNYTVDQAIELLKNWKNKYIVCNSQNCSCLANIPIKKEYDENIKVKTDKLKEILNNKLWEYLTIKWALFIEIDKNINNESISIIYKLPEKDYYINFIIECAITDFRYREIYLWLGIYTYSTNYQWWIIKDNNEYDWLIQIILQRIKKVTPILLNILKLNKWKKQ